LIQQAAPNGLDYFYSDTTGGFAVNAQTSPTAVQNCSGYIGLQFTL
jgi:hypothetical protein